VIALDGFQNITMGKKSSCRTGFHADVTACTLITDFYYVILQVDGTFRTHFLTLATLVTHGNGYSTVWSSGNSYGGFFRVTFTEEREGAYNFACSAPNAQLFVTFNHVQVWPGRI
jgi:hypothetical protein